MFCINYKFYVIFFYQNKKIENSTSVRNGIRGFSDAFLSTLSVCVEFRMVKRSQFIYVQDRQKNAEHGIDAF